MEQEKPGFFAEMKESVENYIHDSFLLAKIEATEKTADVISRVYIFIPLVFILFIILSLATFLAGYYLSAWLGGYWAGFGIMLLLYIGMFFLLVYLHRSKLRKTVADKVVKAIFEKKP